MNIEKKIKIFDHFSDLNERMSSSLCLQIGIKFTAILRMKELHVITLPYIGSTKRHRNHRQMCPAGALGDALVDGKEEDGGR